MRTFAVLAATLAAAAALAGSAGAAGETITLGIASGALDTNGGGLSAADLDPAIAFVSQAWQLEYITCVKLYNYSDEAAPTGNQIEPEAATALPIVSNAGLTYTFTIRSGLGFSSPAGEEVTAASFQREIQRLQTPSVGSLAAAYTSDIASVAAVGNTLTVTLNAPDAGLIHRLTMPLFCAVPSNVPMTTPATAPLGSAGPYYVSALTPTNIVVERNPNYGGTRIRNIGTFEYQLDLANRVTSTLAGSTDVAPFLGRAEVQSITLPEPRFTGTPSNGVFHLHLGTTTTPFDSLTVRQAAALAVDRTAVSAVRGWLPTDQMLAPTMPGYVEAALYPLTAQTQAARDLLGGLTPSFRLCFLGANQTQINNNLPTATVLKANLEAAGFAVALTPKSFFDMLDPTQCEASLSGWIPDFIDGAGALMPILASNGVANASHYSGADAALAAAGATLDPVARAAAYAAIDVDVSGNATPMANLGVVRNFDLVSSRIGCRVFQPAYGLDLHRLCVQVSDPAVPAGGTTTTDTANTGATAQAPLQTGVDLPDGVGGSVTITQGVQTAAPPSGYSFLEQQLEISAPPGTVAAPLVLTFEIDAANLPVPAGVNGVVVQRDGASIQPCTDPTAAVPDPCIASRTTQGDGDGLIVIRTSHASLWSFAVPSSTFVFTGFLSPIGGGLNSATAGSAVPVKFSLGGDRSLAIFPETPTSTRVSGARCGTTGGTPVATTSTTGLQYDPLAQQYSYLWKTDKSWKGQCRRLDVKLVDGTTHSATFAFR